MGTKAHTHNMAGKCQDNSYQATTSHFFCKFMFSVCGIHHTFECYITAGYLLSIRVLIFFKDCQSAQNVSIGIFNSIFITESPSAVFRLAARHSVCGV